MSTSTSGKRRRGLLASVKKNSEAVSRTQKIMNVKKATSRFSRPMRAARQLQAPHNQHSTQRMRKPAQENGEALSRAEALLSTRSRSPSPARKVRPSSDIAFPHKYYEKAKKYNDVLSKSWDPLPGIRLFLDGHECTNALRAAADAEAQNSPHQMWPAGKKFYHVKEHNKNFPVLCEYLKTWQRRRGDGSSVKSSGAADTEISIGSENLSEEANMRTVVPSQPPLSMSPPLPQNAAPRPTRKANAKASPQSSTGPVSRDKPNHDEAIDVPKQQFETEPPKNSVELPSDLSGKQAVGSFVTAYFKKSKMWYPGKIWHVNLDGSIDVVFDDGDRRNSLPAPLVRLDTTRGPETLQDVDTDDEENEKIQSPRSSGRSKIKRAGSTALVPGTLVRARYKMGWKYFPGTVTATNTVMNTVDITYSDGESEAGVPRSAVHALNVHRPSAAAGSKVLGLPVRTRVEAKYGGKKKWFRGVLLSSTEGMQDGRYRVQYDDGDIEDTVKRKHLWCVKPHSHEGMLEVGTLNVGDHVEARHNHGLEWFEATIKGMKKESNGLMSYDLLYSDGDKEDRVERWLIRPKSKMPSNQEKETESSSLVPSTKAIYCSGTLSYNENSFVLTVHEVENQDGDGSTDIFLLPVEGMPSKRAPPPGTVAKAKYTIPDTKIMDVLLNGGLTEAQIAGFASPQDLAEVLVDMVEISEDENGALVIAVD